VVVLFCLEVYLCSSGLWIAACFLLCALRANRYLPAGDSKDHCCSVSLCMVWQTHQLPWLPALSVNHWARCHQALVFDLLQDGIDLLQDGIDLLQDGTCT
jgi:hypothetical protein